jgi:uncharacterized damage-inducible protein DinB
MNTSGSQIRKPEADECKAYFQRYIDLVGPGDFFNNLAQNTADALHFFAAIPSEKHSYRYAENKWTVKELLLHVIDTDRVFLYRALVSARGDNKTELNVVDENLWAANADVTHRSMESLLEELSVVRRSAELLFQNITEEQSKFRGNSDGHPITARALGYIMIGHMLHHMNVVRERYL